MPLTREDILADVNKTLEQGKVVHYRIWHNQDESGEQDHALVLHVADTVEEGTQQLLGRGGAMEGGFLRADEGEENEGLEAYVAKTARTPWCLVGGNDLDIIAAELYLTRGDDFTVELGDSAT
jgi:hypothetical protein